jgi:hypothetical protein
MREIVRENRIAGYREMSRGWRCGDPAVALVRSRDKSLTGYAKATAAPYTGRAGYSSRLRVIWSDGSMTLCSMKGMRPAMPNDLAPGGFRKWTIL